MSEVALQALWHGRETRVTGIENVHFYGAVAKSARFALPGRVTNQERGRFPANRQTCVERQSPAVPGLFGGAYSVWLLLRLPPLLFPAALL